MKSLLSGMALVSLAACASVPPSKQRQVQTSVNQTTAPIEYRAMQRAAAASH